MSLFLSCFPNKPIPTTAPGVEYFLCHSYSESLLCNHGNGDEGRQRSGDDRYIPPFEKQAPQTPPGVEILNSFLAIMRIYEIWRLLLM